ncbi:unnamed protein product [Caenorhabditis nigoni]
MIRSQIRELSVLTLIVISPPLNSPLLSPIHSGRDLVAERALDLSRACSIRVGIMVSIHSNKSAVENTIFSTFFDARRLHGCGCVGIRFATPDIAVFSDAKQVVKQAHVLAIVTVTPNEGTLPGNIHGSSVHAEEVLEVRRRKVAMLPGSF